MPPGPSAHHLVSAQAAALVHVYLDGSVLLTHGGIEMGQGVHTKMIQVSVQTTDAAVYVQHTHSPEESHEYRCPEPDPVQATLAATAAVLQYQARERSCAPPHPTRAVCQAVSVPSHPKHMASGAAWFLNLNHPEHDPYLTFLAEILLVCFWLPYCRLILNY